MSPQTPSTAWLCLGPPRDIWCHYFQSRASRRAWEIGSAWRACHRYRAPVRSSRLKKVVLLRQRSYSMGCLQRREEKTERTNRWVRLTRGGGGTKGGGGSGRRGTRGGGGGGGGTKQTIQVRLIINDGFSLWYRGRLRPPVKHWFDLKEKMENSVLTCPESKNLKVFIPKVFRILRKYWKIKICRQKCWNFGKFKFWH